MSDFLVVAKRPKYKQPSKNGMLVRVRSQDYIDLVKVCDEANVRLCDLTHAVIRYALDHLKIKYEDGGEDDECRRDGGEPGRGEEGSSQAETGAEAVRE